MVRRNKKPDIMYVVQFPNWGEIGFVTEKGAKEIAGKLNGRVVALPLESNFQLSMFGLSPSSLADLAVRILKGDKTYKEGERALTVIHPES